MSLYPEYKFIAASFDPLQFIEFKKEDNKKWTIKAEKTLCKYKRETFQRSTNHISPGLEINETTENLDSSFRDQSEPLLKSTFL